MENWIVKLEGINGQKREINVQAYNSRQVREKVKETLNPNFKIKSIRKA